MTSTTAPSVHPVPPRRADLEIDEALRLRIAGQLAGRFQGAIIGPEDAEYAQARLVWNGMVDKYPGLILRCTSTADVAAPSTWRAPTACRQPCGAVGTMWRARPCPRAG